MPFNPDEYLKSSIEAEFDPNAYLGLPKPEGGIAGALKLGTKSLLGSQATGIKGLFGNASKAAQEGVARQEALEQQYAAPASWEAVKKAYQEKGLLPAAGEAISQVPKAIAQQAPQLAETFAGAAAGTAVAGPFGAVIGAAIPNLVQFFGANLERQAQEQIKSGQPVNVEAGKAALAAVPQTAVDLVETRLLFGSKFLSGALKIPEKSLSKMSTEAVEKQAQEKLLPLLAKGTAKGAAAEIPSEIAQQMLERAQAGLPLTSPDAIAEYGSTAYQVGLLGPLGAVGRAGQRGEARQELAKRQGEAAANAALEQDYQAGIAPTAPDVTGQMGLNLTGAVETAGPRMQQPAPQAGVDQQKITELRSQYDVLERELDRLRTAHELEKDPAKKQAILVQAQKLDYARQELEGQLQGAPARPGQQMGLNFEYPPIEAIAPTQKTRLAEPTVIGQQPQQAGLTPEQELEFAKQRLAAGAPLTPAQELLVRQAQAQQRTAQQAAPAPALEIPNVVGAGARPTSYVVDDSAIDSFGITKGATKFRNSIRGLDLMNPEDAAKFDDLVAKHERKNAKINMEAVEAFKAEKPEAVAAREVPEKEPLPARPYDARKAYQQAREAQFAFGQVAAPLSPRDVRAQAEARNARDTGLEPVNRRNERSVPVPSAGVSPTEGVAAPEAAGVGSAVRPAEQPNGRTAPSGETGNVALAQMAQQVAPEEKPAIPQEQAKAEIPESVDELLARLEVPADYSPETEELFEKLGIPKSIRNSILGRNTPELEAEVAGGNTKAALKVLATSDKFTELDNLLAQGLLDSNKTFPAIEIVPKGVIQDDAPGQYNSRIDTVQIEEGQVDSHTVLHEVAHGSLHSMIIADMQRVAEGKPANPLLKDLKDVYNHAVQARPDLVEADTYGMKNLSEFASEIWSNPKFQLEMANTPYKMLTVLTAFGRKVVKLLTGIDLPSGKVGQVEANTLIAGLIAVQKAMPQGRNVQEVRGAQIGAGIAPAPLQRTAAGTTAEDLMSAFGGKPAQGQKGYIASKIESFNKAKDAWQESYERNHDWVAATFGKGQNIASFDQAFNNRMYNHVMSEAKKGNLAFENAKKALLRISTSQALHRGNLANQIIERGDYKYDPVINRWEATESKDGVSMAKFEGLIKDLATKLGVEPSRAREIMGAAYEANRLNDMYKKLDQTEKDISLLEKELSRLKANRKRTKAEQKEIDTKSARLDKLKEQEEDLNGKVMHKSKEQVDAGMKLYNSFPEIAEGTKVWNKMREKVINLLVETGVKTEDQAERWLDEAAYVPFFRNLEDQKASGPDVMARGLRESMIDRRMHGSMLEVKDPIENMYQWMQWSIARAISNKQLQVMLENYKQHLPEEVREGEGGAGNTFTIYYDGVARKFNVADPAIAQAFVGLEPIIFPGIGAAVKVTNALRHIVTRFPLFSAVQLFSDSYTAMYTSGLKSPFGVLKEIAKEVSRTAQGTSETRELLKKTGILETHDYTAMNEEDAVAKRLGLDNPSTWRKTMSMLDRLSSASDNVIRQGVYNQAIKEGLSHAEAMEKAAEIVNFRRISGDPRLQFASRVIPFFNAYLQVNSVALKTLTGRGISPQERKAAQAVLLSTTAKIMALSAIYSMAIGDDEDYKRKNRVSRDRMFMIPGSGGYGIPIRSDVFALPKIIGEYTYQMMSDKGTTDPKMMKDAMRRAVLGSLMPPSQGIPQIVRPILEVGTNHDFFQDREIVNATMRRLDTDRQFTKNTSEMAKALGAMTGASPLVIDHLLRGYFGTAMTLTALATNDAINSLRGGPPLPSKSAGEMIASLPNMGSFVSKDENTAVLSDFYEAARDVNKANATLKSMKHLPREEQQAYRAEHKTELQLKGMVQTMERQLVTLKQREQRVREDAKMPEDRKRMELDRINAQRDRMSKNVTKLRQRLYD